MKAVEVELDERGVTVGAVTIADNEAAAAAVLAAAPALAWRGALVERKL